MADAALQAMEADLGNDRVKALFESSDKRDRGHAHPAGAGAGLFDLKNANPLVKEWHNFREVDTMRDLNAEAAGDINAGQTHRLNRDPRGHALARRDSAIAVGQLGTGVGGPVGGTHYTPRAEAFPSRQAVGPGQGLGLGGKGNLAVAMELQAMYKKTTAGKNTEPARRRSGYAADTGPRFSPASLGRQDARALLTGGFGQGRLPAKLPGPKIPEPRGARLAMQRRSSAPSSSSSVPPAKLPKIRHPAATQRPPRPSPQPFQLASAEEFLNSVVAGSGLSASKHAPKKALSPEAGANGEKAAAKDAVTPAPDVQGEMVNTPELLAQEPQSLRPVTSGLQVSAESDKPPRANCANNNTSPIDRPVHEDAGSSPMPETITVPTLLPDIDVNSFASVTEEWTCGVDDEEVDPSTEATVPNGLSEGIFTDGTVKGGPYFLAAIIAHIPRIADIELGM